MSDVTVEFGAMDTGLEKTLKTIQDELSAMTTKVKAGELSTIELEAAFKKIAQLEGMEKKVKAIGDESEGSAPKVEKLGNEIKSTGDKTDDAGQKSEIGFGKMAIGAGIAGAAVKAGMMAVELAVQAAMKVVGSFGDAIDLGGELTDLKNRTGIAADQLMILGKAFDNAGVGAGELGPLINKMQKNIVDATDGTSKAAEAFVSLGIPLSKLQSMSPEEQFKALGKAIAGVQDPAQQTAISMEVFGKSGGALKQLFANLDDEIGTASEQLGMLPAIMAKLSGNFDNVGDNIAEIKNKFVEFAAGLLSNFMPALESITDMLSKIDAAKIGADLSQAFIGAGEAMGGFSTAIKGLQAGEFSDSFALIWASISLQVKQTANDIYANLSAAFQTSVDFLTKTLGPDSGAFALIETGFKILGGKIQEGIFSGLANALEGMGPLFAKGAETAKYQMETASKSVEMLTFGLGAQVEVVKDQMTEAGKALPDSFSKALKDQAPLLNVQDDLKKVDELTKKIQSSTAKVVEQYDEMDSYAQDEIASYEKQLAIQEQEVKLSEKKAAADAESAQKKSEETDKMQKQLDLESQMYEAKKSGNNAEIARLKNAQEFNTLLEQAKKSMPIEEAQQWAKSMADIKSPLYTIGDQLKDIAKQKIDNPVLSFSQQTKNLRADLVDMRDYLGGDFSKYDLPTIAEKMGLPTFRKNSKEIMQEIKDHLKGIKDTPLDIKTNIKDSKFKVKVDKDDLKDQLDKAKVEVKQEVKLWGMDIVMNAIMDGVDVIKKTVLLIEPKLPTPALI